MHRIGDHATASGAHVREESAGDGDGAEGVWLGLALDFFVAVFFYIGITSSNIRNSL